MACYAIGDLQGCWLTLEALLARLDFKRGRDTLWFVGDLVNRGDGSLQCLRFVHSLGDNAVVVLGNHDLHLLAVAERIANPHRLDTLNPILNAPDCDQLLTWLRNQKLLHVEPAYAMVHAGLMPQWSWHQAQSLAREIETILRSPRYRDLLSNMYGNEPSAWRDSLRGHARMRFALNAFTRMRTLTADGALDLKFKGEREKMPMGLTPWFDVPSVRRAKRRVIAGHWSALGLYQRDGFIGLDSGCIWGRELSALRLDDGKIFQVASREIAHAEGRE